MALRLDNESRISGIRDDFHRKFPYLKLEFFYPAATAHERFSRKNLIMDGNTKLGEITELNKPGYVNISEYQSVARVEHCFNECFGLPVQVFRRSGNAWIETTHTDEWTLARQNRKGEEMSTAFSPEQENPDIHEQE